MSHVAVEVSGDGGDGGVRITGGEGACFPRAGIRVHGDPTASGAVVVGGRTYGPVKAEMGELSDGDYGIAVLNADGQLTKLEDFIFGPKVATSVGHLDPNFLGRTTNQNSPDDLALVDSIGGPVVGSYSGPSVDVMIGETGRALVLVFCDVHWDEPANSTVHVGAGVDVDLSGANEKGPYALGIYDDHLTVSGVAGVKIARRGRVSIGSSLLIEHLDPGMTTFTCKYRTTFGFAPPNEFYAYFDEVRLSVFPY